MNAIGDVLKRKSGNGPAVIKVVGVDGRRWIVSPEPFGTALSLSGRELAKNYGGDDEPAPEVDEIGLWAGMNRNWLDSRRDAEPTPPLLTPEEKLSAEAAAK